MELFCAAQEERILPHYAISSQFPGGPVCLDLGCFPTQLCVLKKSHYVNVGSLVRLGFKIEEEEKVRPSYVVSPIALLYKCEGMVVILALKTLACLCACSRDLHVYCITESFTLFFSVQPIPW